MNVIGSPGIDKAADLARRLLRGGRVGVDLPVHRGGHQRDAGHVVGGDVDRGQAHEGAAAGADTKVDESVDFDATKNLFIEGDNLDALKALLPYYAGQVKCIFIDPPYSTHLDYGPDPRDIGKLDAKSGAVDHAGLVVNITGKPVHRRTRPEPARRCAAGP